MEIVNTKRRVYKSNSTSIGDSAIHKKGVGIGTNTKRALNNKTIKQIRKNIELALSNAINIDGISPEILKLSNYTLFDVSTDVFNISTSKSKK